MSEDNDATSQVNNNNINLSISDNVIINDKDKSPNNDILLKTIKNQIISHSQKIKVINQKIDQLNINDELAEEIKVINQQINELKNDEKSLEGKKEEDEDVEVEKYENPFEIGCIVDVLQLESNKYINGKIVNIDDKGLFKLEYGGGQSEEQVHLKRMKKPDRGDNGWTREKDMALRTMLAKLKFNREVTRFYFYRVRKEEGYWSWMLIILATFTSTITLGNNVTNEPFLYYFTIIKIFLTLLAACTTLVAAWIKKQGYIERINNCDRYLQKAAQLIEAFDLILINGPSFRMSYSEFDNKLIPIYRNLSTIPPMSPNEQKYCEYLITVNHPELISTDDSPEMRLWPWFEIDFDQYYPDEDDDDDTTFEKKFIKDYDLKITSFGESVIRSYLAKKNESDSCNILQCFGCFNPNADKLVSDYYEYFGLKYDSVRGKPIDIRKTEILTSSNAWENMVNESNKKPLTTFSPGDVLHLNKNFEAYINYIIEDYKLPKSVENNLVGVVVNTRICNNELVYLCKITSINEQVRNGIENNNILRLRAVHLKHINIEKTKALTEDDKTKLKQQIQINDV